MTTGKDRYQFQALPSGGAFSLGHHMQITINQDEQGAITVAMDGQPPAPVEGVEQVCQMIEQALGGAGEQSPQAADAAMAQGFQGVRGGGLNG